MPLSDLLSFLDASPLPLIILALLWKGDDLFSDSLRLQLSIRLTIPSKQMPLRDWILPIDTFLDKLFGSGLLGTRAVLVSFLISLFATLVFFVAQMATRGIAVSDFRFDWAPHFGVYLLSFIFVANPLIDLFSIYLFRRSLKQFSGEISSFGVLLRLALSFVSACLIFGLGVWFSWFVADVLNGVPFLFGFGTGMGFAVWSEGTTTAGPSLLFDVAVATTFSTTFLFQLVVLLLILSTFLLLRLLRSTFFRERVLWILPVNGKPVRSIGIFCAFTYFLLLLGVRGVEIFLGVLR